MKDLFKPIRGDYCHKCGRPRAIECYTKFDKPINYPILLDRIEEGKTEVISKLDNMEIDYMICKSCGEQYFIDWRLYYPMPVRDFMIVEIFLDSVFG